MIMPRALCAYRFSFFRAAAIIYLAFVFSSPVDAGMRVDSLLLTGARSQQLSIVRASLKQGADVNARDELSRTPFMWSAFHGSLTILEVLIAGGTDADMFTRDSSGLNAAERAAEEGHFSLSDRLKNMVPPEK